MKNYSAITTLVFVLVFNLPLITQAQDTMQKFFLSEQKAKKLFKTIEDRGLIVPGKTVLR